MRSLASAEVGPGTANPAGGPTFVPAVAPAPPSARAANAALAQLAKRVARLRIEEVHARYIDADRDLRLQLQLDVGWELRDEVRARGDDALLPRRLLLFLVV